MKTIEFNHFGKQVTLYESDDIQIVYKFEYLYWCQDLSLAFVKLSGNYMLIVSDEFIIKKEVPQGVCMNKYLQAIIINDITYPLKQDDSIKIIKMKSQA